MNASSKIMDTHLHIWDLQRAEYPWLENDTSILNRSYQLGELQSAIVSAGVTHGILVQAANNFEDTDWMLHNAKKYDWIYGVVGWLPLTDPEATEKMILEKYGKEPYFKGVRHLIHNESDPEWLIQDSVITSLRILSDHGLSYDVVGVNDGHLRAAIIAAKQVPGLRMVLDHLNQPPIAGSEKFESWAVLMKEAAACPNLYCKISGLGTAIAPLELSEAHIRLYLQYVLELFRPARCFCGGDWPVSLLSNTYEQTWHVYQHTLKGLLNEREQQLVFWENAKNFYL